eukprot:TRINITY_DN2723_c0_g1_i3.p1 TRINITY_DN2723_c0_g1~~TRINITY_DN2723_c0_g1_i3.p1  ORF type:complete len:128 (+),score=62.96 TRINITY_DN2723_c0_g1_i3:68-451(+)
MFVVFFFFFFQAEDGIRDAQESRGLGDVYKRQVQEALIEYQLHDVSFKQQRENELLEKLVQAVDEKNPELFQQELRQYDNFTKLDNFQTAICLQIKKNIEDVDLDAVMGGQQAEPDLGGDIGDNSLC